LYYLWSCARAVYSIAMKKIPLSSPDITDKERNAVQKVLHSPVLSIGPNAGKFEEALARYAGRKFGVAVNSGTAALHLIIRALGIKEGDEVITTPFSFIASSNCVLFEGAKPVFVDIDPVTLCVDPARIEKAICPQTKAILGVDVFGHPAQWNAIARIAKKHNLKVIEDSAESVGSFYKGKPCGSFGDAAIYSFYPNKQMTTGEGGLVLTDNKEIADLCRSMTNQGRKVEGGKWLEHIRLGYNYRLPEIQCALGLAQFSRLPQLLAKRKKAAASYAKKLSDVSGVKIPFVSDDTTMSWFVYVIQLSEKFSRQNRDRVITLMEEQGIQCGIYFQCIHLQPFYREQFGFKEGDFPITESVSARAIALPFFSNITESQIDRVTRALRNALMEIKHV